MTIEEACKLMEDWKRGYYQIADRETRHLEEIEKLKILIRQQEVIIRSLCFKIEEDQKLNGT